MERPSLLIVDDDDAFRERLVKGFEKRDYEVRAADNGARALELAKEESPELAVVDLRMPGEWGLHVVRHLLEIDENTRVVVLTAYGSIATALEAVRIGAVNFLQKPATVEEIELAFHPGDDNAKQPLSAPTEVPTLARAEWEHINRVLTECEGNIRKASRLLGLHRRTLQRKLHKFPAAK